MYCLPKVLRWRIYNSHHVLFILYFFYERTRGDTKAVVSQAAPRTCSCLKPPRVIGRGEEAAFHWAAAFRDVMVSLQTPWNILMSPVMPMRYSRSLKDSGPLSVPLACSTSEWVPISFRGQYFQGTQQEASSWVFHTYCAAWFLMMKEFSILSPEMSEDWLQSNLIILCLLPHPVDFHFKMSFGPTVYLHGYLFFPMDFFF